MYTDILEAAWKIELKLRMGEGHLAPKASHWRHHGGVFSSSLLTPNLLKHNCDQPYTQFGNLLNVVIKAFFILLQIPGKHHF